jgi:hypothetical protein
MGNAETLFLVNYCKSQVFENNAFLNDFMSADKYVNSSLFQLFDNFRLLFWIAVTA